MQFLFLSWKQFCKSSHSHLSPPAFCLGNRELPGQQLSLTHHPTFHLKIAAPTQLSWGHWVATKEKISSPFGGCSGTLIHSLFQDCSTPDYVPDASIPACPYPFPPITYFSFFASHHLHSSQTLLFNHAFWDPVVVHFFTFFTRGLNSETSCQN